MNYTPFTWLDGSTGQTPISAERLNAIEQGITRASQFAITTLTDSNYSSGVADDIVQFNTLTAARTVTLPTAASFARREMFIVNHTANASAITVAARSGETINGAASKSFSVAWGGARVYSDGTSWHAFVATALV